MKILFVSALLPYPLHSGGQVRIYNLLKRLGKKHEITLATFLRNNEEQKFITELSFCKTVKSVYRGHAWQLSYIANSLFSTYPLLFATYAHQDLKEWITRELQTGTYDLVHIEPSYVWPVLPRVDVPIVVAEHNIEYLGYQGYVAHHKIVPLRPFLMIDVAKLAWWEKRTWKRATRVITVSAEDKQVIEKSIAQDKIAVVPNGVDLSEYDFRPKKIRKEAPVFLFVGNFSWLQNRDAVVFLMREIWPNLRDHFPGATLRIVGRQASADLRALIQKTNAQLLDGVEDIAKEYFDADFLIAPIRIGSGSRYKILEAMASGLPVITTQIGAAGLGVRDKREIMLAQNPQEFIDAVEALVSDQKLRSNIIHAARARIEASFSWEIIAEGLENVWKAACHK